MILILTLALLQSSAQDIERLSRELESDRADVRARAAQIVKEIELALRPNVAAKIIFGKKGKDPAGIWKGDEWVQKAAALEGYETLIAVCGTPSPYLSGERQTLYPAVPDKKPGGVTISARIVELTADKAVVDVSCSIKSWKSGKYTVDLATPRRLIRLTEQAPVEDLFLTLELQPPAEK